MEISKKEYNKSVPEIEQFEFTAKRAIVEQEKSDESLVEALQQQIEVERSKRIAAKQETEAKNLKELRN